MKRRKTPMCPGLAGAAGWVRNGKGYWKCPSCGRTGLGQRQRHLAWPAPIRIPVLGERFGSRSEVVAEALVSPMRAYLLEYKWRINAASGYVYRQSKSKALGRSVNLYLHREILGLKPGDPLEGHHINDNPLDNQDGNLAAVTRSENEIYKSARGTLIRRLPTVVSSPSQSG